MMEKIQPFSGLKLALAAFVLSFGNFIVVLDATITNVAIPTISGDLGVSTSQGTWVITTYAVAEAITVPLCGWLAKRFGEVRVFSYAIFFFIVFSILCGMARSLDVLIFFRVFQGFAGGPIIPLSLTLLLSIFPKNKAHIATSVWGMVTVVAPIFGPILGGWISDNWSWEWIFYINVGLGVLVVIGTVILLRGRENETSKTKIDFIGLGFLVLFVSSFQVMIDKGRDLEWFASDLIKFCGITALLSLIAFVIWEICEDEPIVDLRVFKSRNWTIATLALSLTFGIYLGNALITPLWLQSVMGYTATWSGLAVAPIGILAVVTSPIIGRLMTKIDLRIIITYGMLVIAFSFFMRAGLSTDSTFYSVALPTFVLGAGIPACMIVLVTLSITNMPQEQMAAASGLQNFLRTMSMAVGSSLSQTYWEHMTKVNRAHLVGEGVYNQKITELSHNNLLNMPAQAIPSYLSHLVDVQAAMLATNDFFYLATGLLVLFTFLIWFTKSPKVVT